VPQEDAVKETFYFSKKFGLTKKGGSLRVLPGWRPENDAATKGEKSFSEGRGNVRRKSFLATWSNGRKRTGGRPSAERALKRTIRTKKTEDRR